MEAQCESDFTAQRRPPCGAEEVARYQAVSALNVFLLVTMEQRNHSQSQAKPQLNQIDC
jgi:hypothetical protein